MNTVQFDRRKLTRMQELVEHAIESIECCEELSENKMWSKHGPSIWKANKFVGSPHFYPVYRYEDFYSYSPLSLILLKGNIRLNRRVVEDVARPTFTYYSGMDTIDRDITRVGGPLKPRFAIRERDEYARGIANAMREDISVVESEHPGFVNIILCGGKDSLNLSLLPWKNAVILASQPPNYDLVKKFVAENGLKYDVIRLEDDDTSLLESEILVNCCRINLEHCRWGPHLRRLARTFGEKVIFWKGLWGDLLMTPRWKRLTLDPNSQGGRASRLFRVFRGMGEYRFNRFLERTTLTQRYLFRLHWYRGAMWQGSHVSIMRELTDCLVLSGYHGPTVASVVGQVDLASAVQEDIRPIVGRYLHGGRVVYPAINPGPIPSTIRKGISTTRRFFETLSSVGIRIELG